MFGLGVLGILILLVFAFGALLFFAVCIVILIIVLAKSSKKKDIMANGPKKKDIRREVTEIVDTADLNRDVEER